MVKVRSQLRVKWVSYLTLAPSLCSPLLSSLSIFSSPIFFPPGKGNSCRHCMQHGSYPSYLVLSHALPNRLAMSPRVIEVRHCNYWREIVRERERDWERDREREVMRNYVVWECVCVLTCMCVSPYFCVCMCVRQRAYMRVWVQACARPTLVLVHETCRGKWFSVREFLWEFSWDPPQTYTHRQHTHTNSSNFQRSQTHTRTDNTHKLL